MSYGKALTEELLYGLSPEAVEQARTAKVRRDGPADVENCDYCRSVSESTLRALVDRDGFEEQVAVASFHVHVARAEPTVEGTV